MINVLDHRTDKLLGDSKKYYSENHYEGLKEETFYFVEPDNSKIAPFLNKKNRVIIPVDDGFFREFIIDEALQVENGFEVYTTASYLELKNAEPIAPIKLQGQTINTALDYFLQGTGWKRGITDYAGTRTIEIEEYTHPYSAIKQITNVDTFNLELRFRIETKNGEVVARYVDAVKRIGAFRGREIVSGKDLIKAKRRESIREVVTALYGIGPLKEDGTREVVIVKNEEARQIWGRKGKHLWDIHTPQTDDLEMTKERLTTLTEIELNKRIAAHVSWEIEGVDLENIFGREHEKIRLGDTARVKATDYNPPIYLDSRIIAREGPIRNKTQKRYVLGEIIEYTEDDVKKNLRLLEKQIAKKISESQLVNYAEKIIPEQETPPDPIEHPKWVDTSGAVPKMKLWDGDNWSTVKGEKGEVGPQGPAGKDGIAHMGPNSPSNPGTNATWFQTDSSGKVIAIKKWTGSTWETAKMDVGVLSVLKLSALSADLGDVTAGSLKGVTMNLANGKVIVDANGNAKFGGNLEGASGTFKGSVTTPMLNVGADDISGYDDFGLTLQTAQWQPDDHEPFVKTGKIVFNTLNNALEIFQLNLNNVLTLLQGVSIHTRLFRIIGSLQIDGTSSLKQSSGQGLSLLNGWQNTNLAYANLVYYTDSLGYVFIKGAVTGGSIGTVIATLPVNIRPGFYMIFRTGLGHRIDISTNGNIIVQSGPSGLVVLDGIRFNI